MMNFSSKFTPSWPYVLVSVLPLLALAALRFQSDAVIDNLRILVSETLINIPWSQREIFSGPVVNSTFEYMRSQYEVACPEQPLRPYIFSTDPLVIYLENFLSIDETRHLLRLAEPYYMQSPIGKTSTSKAYDTNIRSSRTAVVRQDPVLTCIERRAVDFQAFRPRSHLEDVQIVRYEVGDHFRPHYDWSSTMANPRVSTIFAYLGCDDCAGGSTQFPRLNGKFSAKWCRFVDCEESEDGLEAGGVGFKPIAGNAIFWSHLHPNGTGHPDVWHAGMPVRRGTKYGMNIMTRADVAYP